MMTDEEVVHEMMEKEGGNMFPSTQTRRLEDRRLVWPPVDEMIAAGIRVRDLDWQSEEQI